MEITLFPAIKLIEFSYPHTRYKIQETLFSVGFHKQITLATRATRAIFRHYCEFQPHEFSTHKMSRHALKRPDWAVKLKPKQTNMYYLKKGRQLMIRRVAEFHIRLTF